MKKSPSSVVEMQSAAWAAAARALGYDPTRMVALRLENNRTRIPTARVEFLLYPRNASESQAFVDAVSLTASAVRRVTVQFNMVPGLGICAACDAVVDTLDGGLCRDCATAASGPLDTSTDP